MLRALRSERARAAGLDRCDHVAGGLDATEAPAERQQRRLCISSLRSVQASAAMTTQKLRSLSSRAVCATQIAVVRPGQLGRRR